MSETGTTSVTSLNFMGFDDIARNSTSPLLFNQIYIAPEIPVSAGKWIHPLAGFIPGQQSYLKRQKTVWNKSRIADNLKLAGFRRLTRL
mgnify:CR=1 FL=1